VVTTFDGVVINGTVGQDVGVPASIRRTSGWDIKSVDTLYDYQNNALHIGINCFGVCGDADGDGDAGVTSPELDALGGKDLPDFTGSESFAVAIDFGDEFGGEINGQFDFVIGYPGGNAANNVLSCTLNKPNDTLFNSVDCFGLYVAAQVLGTNLGTSFVEPQVLPGVQGVLPHPATDHNPKPSLSKPDLEWTIDDLSGLRAKANLPAVDRNGILPWALGFRAFAGSFQDAGIGEDNMPASGFVRVDFLCQVFDRCDVCGGNDSTCLDCAGTPNGASRYDRCDVCGGNDSTCRDCRGDPNGSSVYDVCDVCNGNGSTCRDCRGVPNGSSVYDACDVCGGDGSTCLDCAGNVHGLAVYDLCDLCGGNDSTCRDCPGRPNGATV